MYQLQDLKSTVRMRQSHKNGKLLLRICLVSIIFLNIMDGLRFKLFLALFLLLKIYIWFWEMLYLSCPLTGGMLKQGKASGTRDRLKCTARRGPPGVKRQPHPSHSPRSCKASKNSYLGPATFPLRSGKTAWVSRRRRKLGWPRRGRRGT